MLTIHRYCVEITLQVKPWHHAGFTCISPVPGVSLAVQWRSSVPQRSICRCVGQVSGASLPPSAALEAASE